MKKILILFTIIGSFVLCIGRKADASSYSVGIVDTDGANLNVRSGPSTSYSIIGRLSDKSYVTIEGTSGSFYYVSYSGSSYGYVHKDYINTVSTKKAQTLDNLNIRQRATTASTILATAPKGSILYILSSDTYWSRVVYNGLEGYAYNNYLKTLQNDSVLLNITNYKQYDSRWASLEIVKGKTMRQIGCLTTAFAMSESYRTGTTITPAAMMNRLQYTSTGDAYWPSHYTVSTKLDYLTTIYNNLQNNKPTIIGAKSSTSMHFVIVTGVNGSKTNPYSYTINDPGSSTRTNLGQFFSAYPTFYKIAYY